MFFYWARTVHLTITIGHVSPLRMPRILKRVCRNGPTKKNTQFVCAWVAARCSVCVAACCSALQHAHTLEDILMVCASGMPFVASIYHTIDATNEWMT